MISACLDGKRNDAVGRELGARPNTVGLWRKRFAAGGLAGLRIGAAGQDPKDCADLRLRVLRELELPPPKGAASWDGALAAAARGDSDDAVWRLRRREGVQSRRRRSRCISTDPQFAAKAADIINSLPEPAGTGAGLSVDEKPTIQALERARGHVDQQRQGCSRPQKHLQTAWHGQPVRRPRSGHRLDLGKDDADQENASISRPS